MAIKSSKHLLSMLLVSVVLLATLIHIIGAVNYCNCPCAQCTKEFEKEHYCICPPCQETTTKKTTPTPTTSTTTSSTTTSTTSTTTTPTTTTTKTPTTPTGCQVSYTKPKCVYGVCPSYAAKLGVWCCCSSNQGVKLADESKTCHGYYSNSQCSAVQVECSGCGYDGLCKCQEKPLVS